MASYRVVVLDDTDTVQFDGEVCAEGDYIQLTHTHGASSRVELRATAAIALRLEADHA